MVIFDKLYLLKEADFLYILKVGSVYKIYQKTFLEGLNPFFSPKSFVQNKSYPTKAQDLEFKSLESAKKCIDLLSKTSFSDEERIAAAKIQLEEIFNHFKINPNRYKWADLWTGRMHCGVALSRIVNNEVLCIDRDEESYGPPVDYSRDKVTFLKHDTNSPVAKDITAIFLRSTISARAIDSILTNNPQIELMIVVPEGIGSNEGYRFDPELNVFKNHFLNSQKIDLRSEFCVKGSHSSFVGFCRAFPVIVGQNKY